MDLRIASEDIENRENMDRAISRIATCLPGIVTGAFDPETQTVEVQPTVQVKTYIDDTEGFVDMPKIVRVPVEVPFAAVAGFALTLPIRVGDPCVLKFCQRAIDNWHDQGGIQPPEEGIGSRHHDITDAIASFAAAPVPDVMADWEANGIELRNRNKSVRVTLRDGEVEIYAGTSYVKVAKNSTITIKSTTLVIVDSPLTQFTGNVQVAGGITSLGTYGLTGGKIQTPGDIESTLGNVIDSTRSIEADRALYNSHTHSNPEGGSTGTPTPQE